MNQILVENQNTWRLSGELSFATVSALLAEFTQRVVLSPPKELDLSDVTRIDSAGLALLIELRGQNTSMIFRHIPTQTLNLATLSGVQNLLVQ